MQCSVLAIICNTSINFLFLCNNDEIITDEHIKKVNDLTAHQLTAVKRY